MAYGVFKQANVLYSGFYASSVEFKGVEIFDIRPTDKRLSDVPSIEHEEAVLSVPKSLLTGEIDISTYIGKKRAKGPNLFFERDLAGIGGMDLLIEQIGSLKDNYQPFPDDEEKQLALILQIGV